MSRDANTPSSSKFPVNSSDHSLANLATYLPVPARSPQFNFVFWVCVEARNWFPSGGLLVLRRRLVAGLEEESSVSCVNDVGDVFAVELKEPVDNPGTTIGT